MENFHCNGTDWAVYVKGNGFPVLFLHGFPFDHSLYNLACVPLIDEFRVIIPDLPGFGESQFPQLNPPYKFTMDEYAAGIADLVEQLGEEKVIICGLSMGGYIAMSFFRRYASRLAGLIFSDTRSTPDTPSAAENRLRLADSIRKTGTEPLAEQMIPNLLAPKTVNNHPDVVQFLRDMIVRQSASGIAAAARGMAARDDSTEFLKSIDIPTLVLGGTEDKISPPEAMKSLADWIPRSEYVEIFDSGHLPPLENPVLFADTIRSFVRRIVKTDSRAS